MAHSRRRAPSRVMPVGTDFTAPRIHRSATGSRLRLNGVRTEVSPSSSSTSPRRSRSPYAASSSFTRHLSSTRTDSRAVPPSRTTWATPNSRPSRSSTAGGRVAGEVIGGQRGEALLRGGEAGAGARQRGGEIPGVTATVVDLGRSRGVDGTDQLVGALHGGAEEAPVPRSDGRHVVRATEAAGELGAVGRHAVPPAGQSAADRPREVGRLGLAGVLGTAGGEQDDGDETGS